MTNNRHIIGKVYEVNQSNMQHLVNQLDEALARISELESMKSKKEVLLEHVEALKQFAEQLNQMEDQHQRNEGFRLMIRLEYIEETIEENCL